MFGTSKLIPRKSLDIFMTFKDRIDRLLEIKELDKLSINKIEKALGVDGTIYKGIKDSKYIPNSELVSEIVRIYNLKKSWWDNPVSNNPDDIYEKKLTDMPKPNENKEKTADEVYRDIVEGNTEYILIPRSVLQEKYRLVSIEKLEEDRENWKKDKAVIDRLLTMYEDLAAEMKIRLKSEAETPVMKEAQ
jgi:hypothetical protein